MRAATYDHFGKPTDVLSVGDRPMPQPAANEVRIKTILSPIHNHDLLTVRGQYGYKPEMPAVGGSEALGIIDAVITSAVMNRGLISSQLSTVMVVC